MSKQPFMPLFFGDFLASTATWDGEERALYVLLLGYQWSVGALPTDLGKLARVVQYDAARFKALWKVVGSKFVETEAGLVNDRLEQHRTHAAEISAKRAAVASKRWSKEPANPKQNPEDCSIKSDAIASSLHIHPNQTKPNQTTPILEPIEISSQGPTPVAQALPAIAVGPDETIEVFDHWRHEHNHLNAKLDDKRRKVIRNALKHYGVTALCDCISGYRNSPHHMGVNDSGTRYDSIELMLRDAKHIDAGLAFYSNPPQQGQSLATRRAVSQTRDWIPPELRNAND